MQKKRETRPEKCCVYGRCPQNLRDVKRHTQWSYMIGEHPPPKNAVDVVLWAAVVRKDRSIYSYYMTGLAAVR
eukprot:scaffold166151_cov36-Prasinocladus_malaysianus.AAC.1